MFKGYASCGPVQRVAQIVATKKPTIKTSAYLEVIKFVIKLMYYVMFTPQIFNQIFIVLAGGGLEAGHFDGPDSAEKIMAEIYTRGPIVATMFVHYVMFYA